MLPGMITWTVLLMPFVLSWAWPYGIAYFIIVFDAYWLTKALVMGGHLIFGFMHMRRAMRVDWLARVKQTDNLHDLSDTLLKQFHRERGFEARRLKEEWEQVEHMRLRPVDQKSWHEVIHAVVYAIYKGP